MKKNRLDIKDYGLLIIAILAITISTNKTRQGILYASGDPTTAWMIAIIISLALLILNYHIRTTRIAGLWGKTVRSFVLYTSVALISFSANFNSFYSNSMKEEIIYDNIEELEADLNKIKTTSIEALMKKYNYETLQTDILSLKTTLTEQILDKNQPGVGQKARLIISDIEKILGAKLTEPYGIPEDIKLGYDSQIDALLKIKTDELKNNSTNLIEEIESIISSHLTLIDSAKQMNNFEYSARIAEKCYSAYNQIGETVNGKISDQSIFSFDRKTFDNLEIGQINYTYKSVKDSKNISNIILPLILCFLIDFSVPLLIILLTGGNRNNNKNKPNFPIRDIVNNTSFWEQLKERSIKYQNKKS